MIAIKPDPAHPRGGYAELSLGADEISGETAEVSVFDNYSERFLGEKGWQATRVAFGPYQVVRDGAQALLVIGPEIVNQIEEYANVRLYVGGAEQDIAWPDEIVPAPGAAKIGGIASNRKVEAAPVAPMAPVMPGAGHDKEDETDADRGSDTEGSTLKGQVEEDDAAAVSDDEKSGSKAGVVVAGFIGLLIMGGGAYWYLNQEDEPVASQEQQEPVVIGTPEPVVIDTCSLEALRGLDGFLAQAEALRGCGDDANADSALALLEQGVASEDSEALRLFGVVYDKEVEDLDIEKIIGLSLPDNPATAAEYYARAAAAGSDQAKEHLSTLCTRLETMSDTLAQGAFDDHCGL